ncbi:hypothetical protein AAVH_05637 [Aphelenchoides avenae]|nr:hypothetical protein AAVH_05637 [Aphelenchus avenae]
MSRDSPQRKAARRRTPPGNGGGSGGSNRSPNPADPNMVPLRTFPAPPKQRSPSEHGRRSPGQKSPEGGAPPRSRSSGPLMAPPGGGRSALGSPPDDGRGGSGRPDVNPRGARGKLGGVAGKSGAPEGWKPWGKNDGAFSSHPGFLDD